MKTIHKYPISNGVFELKIPAGAKILDAFVQDGEPFLWAEVETFNQLQTERFMTLGTGHPFPSSVRSYTYISTFQDGPYIWHLYQIILK
jgi:hypothetical protein